MSLNRSYKVAYLYYVGIRETLRHLIETGSQANPFNP